MSYTSKKDDSLANEVLALYRPIGGKDGAFIRGRFFIEFSECEWSGESVNVYLIPKEWVFLAGGGPLWAQHPSYSSLSCFSVEHRAKYVLLFQAREKDRGGHWLVEGPWQNDFRNIVRDEPMKRFQQEQELLADYP